MRRFVSVSVIALLCCITSASFAKESAESILLLLPKNIVEFKAETPMTYGDPRLGASLGYNNPAGIAVTLYLYDLGQESIPDGIASEVIVRAEEEAINEIKDVAKQGYYGNLNFSPEQEVTVTIPGGKAVTLLKKSFSYAMAMSDYGINETVWSDLYMTGVGGYICKIRVSRSAVIGAERDDEIESLIQTLVTELAK